MPSEYIITSRNIGVELKSSSFVLIFLIKPKKIILEETSPPKYIPKHLEQTRVLKFPKANNFSDSVWQTIE